MFLLKEFVFVELGFVHFLLLIYVNLLFGDLKTLAGGLLLCPPL